MARKTRKTRKSKRVSLKPLIKDIQSSQKALVKTRKSATTAAARQQLKLNLANLRSLERIAKAMCRQDFLPNGCRADFLPNP